MSEGYKGKNLYEMKERMNEVKGKSRRDFAPPFYHFSKEGQK